MGKRKRSRVVLGERGDPCPRCGRSTEVREHGEITPKHRRQPYYYSRWFYCTNPKCKTSMIMPDRFRVFRRERQPVSSSTVHNDDVVMSVLAEQDGAEQDGKPPWED
jgi:hypothetical protein